MRLKIMILLLIGIIAFSGVVVMTQGRAVLAVAEGSLAGELTKALGNDASIQDVEIASIRSVVLRGVNFYDKQNRLVAAAPAIEVSFSLTDVIFGRNSLQAIKEIVIFSPRVELFQRADGRWNIEDLLDRPDQTGNSFSAKVKIADASVAVTTPQGNWQAEKLSGSLDFVHNPWIAVKVSGTYQGNPISAEGKITSKFDGALTLKAARVGLNSIAGLLPRKQGLQMIDGFLKDTEITLAKDKDKLSWAGETTVEDLSADAENFRIRGGKGLITFTEKQLYCFSSAVSLNEQPVEIRGKISLNTSEPVFDLHVTSSGLDPAAFWPASPLSGPVAVDADVKGTMARPLVKATLQMDKGELNGQAIAGVRASVELTDRLLAIHELKADLWGGQMQAGGTVDIAGLQYNLQVQGRNLDSGAAGFVPGLAGAVSFDAAIEGHGALENADIHGTCILQEGKWRGISFRDASAGFDKTASKISLPYFSAKMQDGSLAGHGTIDGDTLDITLLGHNVPLMELNKIVNGMAFDGLGSFEGNLRGTTGKPEFNAAFRAEKGQALYQPFQEASGSIKIDTQNISLVNVWLIDGNAKHNVQGTIGLSQEGALNLAVVTQQARAENLIKLIAPGERLTGNVDHSAVITGTIHNPTVSGRFKLTEGSFRGYLIAGSDGSYERSNGITVIRDVVVNSLNARISLAGTIGADNGINLDLSAKNVDLARLHVSYPYPVQGLVNFTGKLSGAPSNINFTGELTAANVRLNGQNIDNMSASVAIAGDEINIPVFSFAQGQGRYSFSGGIDTAYERIYGGVEVENGELGPLLTIFNIPVKDIGGNLNGHIAVSGSVKKPNIWLTGNLSAGRLRNYPLDNIDIDVSLENNIITVNRFLAKQGTGILAIRGMANLEGPVNLEVGGRDLDAGLLTVWLDSTIDTKGKLDFAAQMTGTAQNPYTAVSLEIKGGGVSNATFDNLYGLFIIDKGSIHVNQLLLTKGSNRASAYGLIPLAALNREGRKNATIADQMDLHIRLDQADLSILPLLTKEVAWANGRTEGELAVAGTLMQPDIHGGIRVENGSVKLKSLADPIQKVAVDIQFEGDKINIKSFDGVSGGGSYRLAGTASLRGTALEDYQLLLTIDRFKINHKYFKGPLTGTLTLTQAGAMPKLSGKMVLENDEINIPFIPEVTASDINAGLDLELTVGGRVRFYNPYMYDIIAAGRVKAGGTTQQPAVSGRIEASRGTVNYLRTEFKIKEARADFTQFGSFEPAITLSADTRLERTTVSLKANGPVSAMDFNLTSEPAMSQQEILSLLTLRSRYFDKQNSGGNAARDSGLSRDEVIGLLDAGLQMRFVVEMEDAFRKAFGLDGFKLIKGTLADTNSNNGKASSAAKDQETTVDREVYNVEISKYVNDRLMLSYTFGIDHKEYTAAFRYDITKRISLTGSVDEYNRRRFGIETRFSF